jgi:hypothetical protein
MSSFSVVDPLHVDVDPLHVDADPDSTHHSDADPDSHFLFDADPDSDQDPSFKKMFKGIVQ